ncbi:AI-2E family transporter [Altererythrobacter sp. H2]|uniref:AI-2E family transporter n=1 Tax=Altererythrobacter sp. H2 TaxID=3108391 RepID=UPI002B4BEC43|nr:AI-2E family transporter [Altererythrobacter sp. H2]WRK95837.1 AI-2E family transporter [Altererythrobacter sp. H2]
MKVMGEGETIERAGFLILLGMVTVALFYIVLPFAGSLLWATLAAIMFQPLFQRILRRRPGRPNEAAIGTLLIITFAVILPAVVVGSAVVEEAAGILLAFQEGRIDLAGWFRQLHDILPANVRTAIDDAGWGDFASARARVEEFVSQSAGMIAQQAVAFGGGAFGAVLSFGVWLYVTYFLLRDGSRIGPAVLAGLPVERGIAQRLAEKFIAIVRATIKGSFVVGLVQGALGAITFWIAGLPSVALFGVLMAIFSFLPAIGPALVWVPAAIWLLATGAIWEGLVVIFSGVAVIGLADNLLRPMLVGRDTGIPDWIILVTTLGGIALLGLSGIVLGPLVAGLFLAGWSIVHEQREAEAELVHPA